MLGAQAAAALGGNATIKREEDRLMDFILRLQARPSSLSAPRRPPPPFARPAAGYSTVGLSTSSLKPRETRVTPWCSVVLCGTLWYYVVLCGCSSSTTVQLLSVCVCVPAT